MSDDARERARLRARKIAYQKRRRQMIIRRRLFLAGFFIVVILLIVGLFSMVSCVAKKVGGSASSSAEKETSQEEETVEVVNEGETKETYPVSTYSLTYSNISPNYKDFSGDDKVSSPYAALLDVDNHTIIAGKDATKKIYPASMTKIMTLIIVSEHMNEMPETFTFSQELITPLINQQASRAGFSDGETVGLKDIIYGLILPSGADSADALAIMLAGSNENFAKLMNDKCKELGLKNTHFANPSGLHDENQYTTPQEMTMIMEYAMMDEFRADVLGTYQYKTAITPYHPEGILLTSTMYSRIYGNEAEGVLVKGGKTGFVNESGSCLVSYAETSKGHKYIFCTSGAVYKWAPVYDEIHVYEEYIPESEKDKVTMPANTLVKDSNKK